MTSRPCARRTALGRVRPRAADADRTRRDRGTRRGPLHRGAAADRLDRRDRWAGDVGLRPVAGGGVRSSVALDCRGGTGGWRITTSADTPSPRMTFGRFATDAMKPAKLRGTLIDEPSRYTLPHYDPLVTVPRTGTCNTLMAVRAIETFRRMEAGVGPPARRGGRLARRPARRRPRSNSAGGSGSRRDRPIPANATTARTCSTTASRPSSA